MRLICAGIRASKGLEGQIIMRWTRGRISAVVGLIAIAGMALAVLPAFGDDAPPAVSLHLSTAGQFFEYGTTTQTLTTSRCEVNERSGPLFDINRKAGLDSFGLGYKSGGAQGTPCGRIEVGESLDLAIHNSASPDDPLEGRMFSGMRLDLELKKNAWVVVDLYQGATKETFQLATGASIDASDFPNPSDTNPDGGYSVTSDPNSRDVSCASPSDSGPDSGASDNCLWTITAAQPFNRIVISTKVGEVSLEGGADYQSGRAYDTLFYLANAGPVANDDTATTDEGSSTTVNVLGNDTDADEDTLTVASVTPVKSDGTTATVGSVSVSNGVVTYDPNGQFEGLNVGQSDTDEFTYTVSDGKGGSDTAVVTVTITGVNNAPVVKDSSASGDEDSNIDVDLDITDPDDSTFTSSCTSDDGTFSDDGDGTGKFTPNPNFNGTATLSCTVTDSGNASDTATVTVTVNPVNDAPVANDDLFYFDDLDPKTVIDLTQNDSDIDGDTLTVSAVDTTGTLGTVDLESGVVSYTPPAGFLGSDSFGYTVSDGNGGTDTATVTIEEVIQCGEDLTAEDGNVWARYLRIDDSEGGGDTACVPKPYDLEIIQQGDPAEPVVKFVPREPLDGDGNLIDAPAKFSAEVSFEPVVASTNAGGGDDSNLEYDADAEGTENAFVPMQWCTDSTLQFIVVDGALTEVRVTDATLPGDETWCIAYKRTYVEVIDGIEVVRSIWTTFGAEDPFKRLS